MVIKISENNKEVIQAYLFTVAKHKYNVYEKRILYRLVEMCQIQIKGQNLDESFKIDPLLFGDHKIQMPINAFLRDDRDKNYGRVEEALMALNTKNFELIDGKSWRLVRIIEKPFFDKENNIVTFELQPPIYEAILNFSSKKGYRKFELKTAFMLESSYSMRAYELVSGQKKPLKFKVEKLRDLFCIDEGKYKSNSDLIKNTLGKAKIELDKKKTPYSFNIITKGKEHKIGRKIEYVSIVPIHHKEYEDKGIKKAKTLKNTDVNNIVDTLIISYLKDNFGFTDREIKNNYDLINSCNYKFSLKDHINNDIKPYLSRSNNPKAYIISSLKNKLNQCI